MDISHSLTKESEDENSFEEPEDVFISKQIQAKNRKKKKSGGFQSMGKISLSTQTIIVLSTCS